MEPKNPWQEFNNQAERKAFQSTVLTSLKGWAINWLEANAKKGEKGDKGDKGDQGFRGPQGPTGPKGERGARGADGRDGEQGPPGPQGIEGKPGRDGRDGRDGKNGKRGQRGEKGDPGPQGPPGPAGGGGGGINRFAFRGGASNPGSNDGFADDKWINYTSKEVFYRDENTDNWTSLGTLGGGGGGGGISDGDKGDITVSSSGTVWTIDNSAVTNAKVASGIDAAKIADGSVSNTEFQYIGTLTSDAQTQLDGKLATGLAVLKADYTPAHSLLVQQSGTGSPTALQVGNNTLVGRLAGGGSDIDDLSTTDVRTLLSISNVDNTSDADKPISTATQTALDAKQPLATVLTNTTAAFTTAQETKLAGIAAGAEVNVNADWNAVSGDAQILNKPTLGTLASQDGTFSGTSSGTNTGDQNLFSTIAVSGQSNVVADSTSDTLTLVAGSNITITTDASTDSVTIAASGGGGGVSDGDKGDITVSSSGATWTIDNDAVTYAKMQNVTDARLLGRSAGTDGDCQEITVGAGLTLSSGALTATADVVGPGSATDNALVRFDGTTGKLIQDSASALSDDGALTLTNNSGANTGMVAAYNWIRLASDYTLTNTTAAQKIFNTTTNGTLTLPTGVYFFESLLYMLSMSATSGNAAFHLLGGGTATLASILYQVGGKDATTPTNAGTRSGVIAVTQNTVASMVAAGTATGIEALINGTFTVSSGGTLIPSVALVTGAAAIMKAGTYFKCWRAGDNGTDSMGAWT